MGQMGSVWSDHRPVEGRGQPGLNPALQGVKGASLGPCGDGVDLTCIWWGGGELDPALQGEKGSDLSPGEKGACLTPQCGEENGV